MLFCDLLNDRSVWKTGYTIFPVDLLSFATIGQSISGKVQQGTNTSCRALFNDHEMSHNAIVLFKGFKKNRQYDTSARWTSSRLAFSRLAHFGDARRLCRVIDILRQMFISTKRK